MTIEEIKKNAPKGATHYWDYPASNLPIDYYKIDNDFLYVWTYWLDEPKWAMTTSRIGTFKTKPL